MLSLLRLLVFLVQVNQPLLRSINRLNEITDGEILIDGKSITKANKKELKKIRTQIGLISQSFNLVKT